jgi:ELWxxDGT repeat protein
MINRYLYTLFSICLSILAAFGQKSLAKPVKVTNVISVGDIVYFSASENSSGEELWVSDGTPEGSQLLKDISPGYLSSSPDDFIGFKGKLFFSAFTPEFDRELWVSDGTREGTVMLADLEPSSAYYQGSNPKNLCVFKDYLYFTTSTGKLYKTDGTPSGTNIVDQIPYGRIGKLTVFGDDLYYYKGDGVLTLTNGTTLRTIPIPTSVLDIHFNSIYATDQTLFAVLTSTYLQKIKFYAYDQTIGTWVELKYFNAPLYGNHELNNITVAGNKLFFNLRTDFEGVSETDELWVSDGSVAGTAQLKTFNWSRYESGSGMENFKEFKGALYFRNGNAAQRSLWRSDGTVVGTTKLHDVVMIQPYNIASSPVESGGQLFFCGAMSSDNDYELWVTDGTTAGTKLFADLNQSKGSIPHRLCDANGTVYCVTQDDQFSSTIWSMAPAPEINLRDLFSSISNGGSINFSEIKIDECIKKSITVENVGRKELIVSNIRLIGDGFYLKGNLPEVINPKEKFVFDIYFTPLTVGAKSVTLSVFSNDQNEPQYEVTIKGTARTPLTANYCQDFDETFKKELTQQLPVRNIRLSNAKVAELQPAGSVVGLLSVPESSASISYSFIRGRGDEDNYQFLIMNNKLLTRWPFRFTSKNTYTIRVLADAAGVTKWEANFVIEVGSTPITSTTVNCKKTIERMDFSINDIALNNAGELFAVTNNSRILVSSDEGVNWKLVNTGGWKGAFKKIVFKGSTGYITGENSILKSEDNGTTWFQLFVPTSSSLNYFTSFFLDELNGFIGNYEGTVFFTKDGGKTWEIRTVNLFERISGMWFFDNEKGFAIKGNRELIYTNNGGKTWSNISLSNLGYLYSPFTSITFLDPQNGFLTSYESLYRTTNGGNSWTKVNDLYGGYFSGVRFFNSTTGYLYGGWNSSELYKTTNGGLTWTNISLNSPGSVSGIVKTAKDKLVTSHVTNLGSSTSAGRVLNASIDGGTTWQRLQELPGVNYWNIDFVNQEVGYVFSQSAVWKTADGGLSWNNVQWSKPISSTYFFDKNNAVLSDGTSIYKTSDGGQTITQVLKTDQDPNRYIPAGVLYGIGDQVLFSFSWYALYRSVDGGNNWQIMSDSPNYYMQDLQFISANVGYSMELFGSIRKTIDGGASWTEIFTRSPTESAPHNSLFFVTESIGYKGGRYFYKTLDGGVTWAKVFTNFGGDIIKLHFMNATNGYAVTRNGFLYETLDGGINWLELRLTDSYGTLSKVEFKSGSIYYCGELGTIGQISKYTSPPEPPGYIVGPTSTCIGETETYFVAKDYYVDYLWESNTATVQGNGAQVNVKFPEKGIHSISLKLTNSCGISESRKATIEVKQLDKPVIEGERLPFAGQTGVEYRVTNNNPLLSYTWSVPKAVSFIPKNSESHSINVNWKKEPGSASVSVISADRTISCMTQSRLEIELTAVTGLESNCSLMPYPNPTADELFINSDCGGSFEGALYNIIGQELMTVKQSDKSISLIRYPPGLYLLKLQNHKTGETRTFQVIKV